LRLRGDAGHLPGTLLKPFPDALDHALQVGLPAHDVEPVGIDGQDAALLIAREEALVGLGQGRDVLGRHAPLVGPVAQGDALHQGRRARAQVDHEVGSHDALGEGAVQPLVGVQFVTVQVQVREQAVLGEGIVAEERLPRQEAWHLALLVIAAEQEKDLRLEREPLAVGVKVGEEGILLKDLEQEPCAELGLQRARQGRLAYADGTLDGNVDSLGHRWGLLRPAWAVGRG
jgi:hypothetical protein